MLYGRRQYEPHFENSDSSLDAANQDLNANLIVHRSFQYKYTWYIITAVAGGTLLFLIPAYYFIWQNYNLFKTLAFDYQPGIIQHLERELLWLKIFMGLGFIVISVTAVGLGVRMTKTLIAPLIRLEKHMRQLMLGNWHIQNIRHSTNDDFRDITMTYDYFHRALKANTEAELTLLKKLSVDPHNREAYAAWKQLIDIKRARLGLDQDTIFHDEASTSSARQHRAS